MENSVEEGGQRIREVFEQPIEVLLSDHRAVKILTRCLALHGWFSTREILTWVAENIGSEYEPFPKDHPGATHDPALWSPSQERRINILRAEPSGATSSE